MSLLQIAHIRHFGTVPKVYFLFAFLMTLHCSGFAQEEKTADFERILEIVRNSHVSKDWDNFRKTAERVNESWPEGSYAHLKLVYEVCARLNSTRGRNKDQRQFLQSLACATVEKRQGPVDLRARIAAFIKIDFDHREGHLRGGNWVTSRRNLMRTVLVTYQGLEREVDTDFNFDDLPSLNVAPPGGRYPSGISPEAIKEPEIRREYEKALKANANKATRHSQQRNLHELIRAFLATLEANVVGAYSIEPVNTEEVKADFKEYGVPQELIDRVVQKLKARALALSIRPPPPKMMFKDPPNPPGSGPHHADLRLRKRVTFNLARPPVEAVLGKLRETTGVEIGRAEEIPNKYPATASISVTGVPAWQVMDDLAALKRVEGRWKKDGAGYRLVPNGTPPVIEEEVAASPADESAGRIRRNLIIAAILALPVLLMVGFALFKGRRAKARPY